MTENEFEKWMSAHHDTQAGKKFRYYMREILGTKEVHDFIIRMRELLIVPKGGFDGEKIGYKFPPEGWLDANGSLKTFRNEIKKLCKDNEIHYFSAVEIFEALVFYNNSDIGFQNHGGSLCMVTNLAMEAEDPYSDETQADDNRLFPLAIRFSPYATKRDLLDYISKIYKYEILPIQQKYRKKDVKLGSFKKRNPQIKERDEFIFENRHKTLSEIASLIGRKFGTEKILDAGYIGKIISNERKRRKEV